jgi:hypothetical protein
MVEWGRPANIVLAQLLKLLLKLRVSLRLKVSLLQFRESGHQGLGHKLASELPKVAVLVR